MSHARGSRPGYEGKIRAHISDWLRVGVNPAPELRRLMAPVMTADAPVGPKVEVVVGRARVVKQDFRKA